jgi:putative flippase GtrA
MKALDPRNKQIVRFLIAGAANTFFGFAIYSIAALAGAANWQALLIGMVTGVLFNFFTTGGYAFRQLSWRRFPIFFLCHIAIFSVNLVLLEMLSTSTSRYLVQFVLAFPMALASYVLMSRVAFPTSSHRAAS